VNGVSAPLASLWRASNFAFPSDLRRLNAYLLFSPSALFLLPAGICWCSWRGSSCFVVAPPVRRVMCCIFVAKNGTVLERSEVSDVGFLFRAVHSFCTFYVLF